MATYTQTTFVVYQDQFFGGWTEMTAQNADAFNAASRNGIVQRVRGHRGAFTQESFILALTGSITRRDTDVVTAATPTDVTMEQVIGTKLARKIYVEKTIDAWKKIGADAGASDDQLLSFYLGGFYAKEIQLDWLNTGITAAVGALSAQAPNFLPLVANEMASTTKLNQGLKLLGDDRNNVVCWIGNGIAYADLVQQNINDNVQDLTGAVMFGGDAGTMGKPFIVTDSPALTNTGGGTTGDSYYILGLKAGGLTIEESESQTLLSELVGGKENIVGRLQSDLSYTVKLAGMRWDTAIENPTDAQIGTGANWTKVATSHKNLAGVLIEVDNK